MLKLRISGAKLILSICPHGLHITHLCRLNFLILLFLISMNLPPGVPNSKPKVLSSLSALPEHLLSPMICVSFRNITLSYAEVLAYGLCPKFLISTNSRSAQSSAQIPLNMSLCRYLFVDFRTSVVLTALQVLLYLAAATWWEWGLQLILAWRVNPAVLSPHTMYFTPHTIIIVK